MTLYLTFLLTRICKVNKKFCGPGCKPCLAKCCNAPGDFSLEAMLKNRFPDDDDNADPVADEENLSLENFFSVEYLTDNEGDGYDDGDDEIADTDLQNEY